MKTVASLLLMLLGCGGPPPEPDDARGAEEPEPAAPEEPSADLSDPPGGMTLRLPEPGTSRADVVADHPGCAEDPNAAEGDAECRFHGWLHPLSQHCENGCTWWTYRFEDDALAEATLERSEWDVNAEWAARFTAEGRQVAAELSRRLRAQPSVEVSSDWLDAVSAENGEPHVFERRTWTLPDRRVVWSLVGDPGHHPGITLRVVQTAP